MDEVQPVSPSASGGNNSKSLVIVVVAVIVILAIAAGGVLFLKNKNKTTSETTQTQTSNATSSNTTGSMMHEEMMSAYKDGTYEATGSYSTPGGTEQVGVKVTLKDGNISDAQVTQLAKSPTAKVKQADFAANYKPFVVGKNIDEVNLTVVSGSSLTPKGFNSALDQIKSQAKSSS